MNGETVIVSADGLTNDGQHRCHSVIRSGISVSSFFVFGVTRDSRFTLDVGKKRTAGNVFTMKGFKNANVMSTASRLLLAYDQRKLGSSPRYDEGALEQHYLANADALQEGFASASEAYRRIGGAPGAMTAAYVVFSRIDNQQAKRFYSCLAEATVDMPGDRILVLRNLLNRHKDAKDNIHEIDLFAAFTKTWNVRRKKIRASGWVVRWLPGEAFPVAQ